MKHFILTASLLILSGCGTLSTPEPERTYVDIEKVKKLKSEKQMDEYFRYREISNAACINEANKIVIPSPSCVVVTKPTGYGCVAGCKEGYVKPTKQVTECDYSAVRSAKSQQRSTIRNCMLIKGFKRMTFPEMLSALASQSGKKLYPTNCTEILIMFFSYPGSGTRDEWLKLSKLREELCY